MKDETKRAVKAILATDASIRDADARKALAYLEGADAGASMPDDGDVIITREQTAALLGKSLQSVDVYGRRGIIKRVYLLGRGRRQCQGYSRRSVLAAIAAGAETQDAQ